MEIATANGAVFHGCIELDCRLPDWDCRLVRMTIRQSAFDNPAIRQSGNIAANDIIQADSRNTGERAAHGGASS